MHIKSEPAVLYFGTPVVLVSTMNEDGTTNVAPMSSCWWQMGRHDGPAEYR
jgi:flavin reductase (DIM6/NTAB) family NADH-FMN oxidoreductase RutF